MKVKAESVGQQIKKTVLPVYLVNGDVPLLMQECCDQIRASLLAAGFTEKEVFNQESGFDWQSLLDASNSMSLFGDRKLIDLRMPKGKPGDKGSKAICEYLENPSEDNVLMITCNKLDAAAQRSKWYKAIDAKGAVIQVWPIDLRHLPAWINNRLRQKGLEVDREAIQIIADKVEGNLLAAAQEIEKLTLLFGNPEGNEATKLSSEQVLASISNNARYDLFAYIDEVLLGKSKRAIKMLRGLKEEGTEATVILWGLSRELRTLIQISEDMKNSNINACFQKYRVWDKRKPIVSACLKNNNASQLGKLLQECAKVDKAIKGQSQDSPWNLLEQITVNFGPEKMAVSA